MVRYKSIPVFKRLFPELSDVYNEVMDAIPNRVQSTRVITVSSIGEYKSIIRASELARHNGK